MWELTKRISLRISSVLSKVEPEPGDDQKVPAPALQHCWYKFSQQSYFLVFIMPNQTQIASVVDPDPHM